MNPSERRFIGGRLMARASVAAALLVALLVACTTATPSPSITTTPRPTATAAPTALQALYDFGDAPDPTYPTLLASNGARTRVIDQFWLGNLRSPSVTNEVEAKVVNLDELDDGLESYVVGDELFGDETALTFRAVKSASAGTDVVYFNLLVDLDGDGRWLGEDWVERNREVDLAPGEQRLIEVGAEAAKDTWIRVTLTDTAVTTADWDGTGEFATGEVEDYYLPPTPPYSPPPSGPPYTPTPTPTHSPTPTPTPERTILTPTHGPTAAPSPTVVYTGDFVVKCDPDPVAVVHGESVTMALKVVSGQHTPPERFRASVLGGDQFGGGNVVANPAPDGDGWSDWGDGASLMFTSTHVDPPARVEIAYVAITLQSLSTTRTEYCAIRVTHLGASPVPTQIQTPTIRVEPEIVSLQLVGQVRATLSGTGFTPGGQIDLRIKPPNHPATNATERAGNDGRFSLDLHFQQGMPRGSWQVTATDRSTGQVAETTFTVR